MDTGVLTAPGGNACSVKTIENKPVFSKAFGINFAFHHWQRQHNGLLLLFFTSCLRSSFLLLCTWQKFHQLWVFGEFLKVLQCPEYHS